MSLIPDPTQPISTFKYSPSPPNHDKPYMKTANATPSPATVTNSPLLPNKLLAAPVLLVIPPVDVDLLFPVVVAFAPPLVDAPVFEAPVTAAGVCASFPLVSCDVNGKGRGAYSRFIVAFVCHDSCGAESEEKYV